MTAIYCLAALLAVSLMLYLLVALVVPERFS